MKLIKSLKQAFNMVIHSKLRSWLTIIGIVIGVASVIAIVSFGAGMEANINEQMSGTGTDILTITPGYSKAGSFGPGRQGSPIITDEEVLDRKDVQVLKGVSELEFIDTRISGQAEIYFLGQSSNINIEGVDQKVYSDISTDEIAEGRMLDAADQNVVVIGDKLANEYFDDPITINKIITIEDKAFRVVGILEEGTSSKIIMPITSAYQVLEDKTKDEYDSIIVQLKEDEDIDLVEEEITKKLMNSRHVTEDDRDFTISSNAQMAEMMSEMTETLSLFLTGIAAISLLVGAVGIANTMFTSVLEKTKEIGIMKAIGAKNNDILAIFVFNSAIIGLVGGLLGLILGYVLSKLLGMAMRIDTIIAFSTVLLSLGVSVLVGMIAGIIPAYQGSKLKPVDALRYE